MTRRMSARNRASDKINEQKVLNHQHLKLQNRWRIQIWHLIVCSESSQTLSLTLFCSLFFFLTQQVLISSFLSFYTFVMLYLRRWKLVIKGIIRPFSKNLELFSGNGRQSWQMEGSDVFCLKLVLLANAKPF